MLLLKEAVEKIKHHFASTPPSQWVRDEPTQEDIQHLVKQ